MRVLDSHSSEGKDPLGGALQEQNYKFGWLRGVGKLLKQQNFWLRRPDTYRIDNSRVFRSGTNWFTTPCDLPTATRIRG